MTDLTLAIDPGTDRSAWVVLRGAQPLAWDIEENDALLVRCRQGQWRFAEPMSVVIEMVQSYGMRFVGEETYMTCVMVGRLIEALRVPVTLLHRQDVKMHLLGAPRGKDPDVRAALLDLYGGRAKAIGVKASPGPLHGMRQDLWAALAVGRTYQASPRCHCHDKREGVQP